MLSMEKHAKKNNLQEEGRLKTVINAYDIQKKNSERSMSIEQRTLVTRLHQKLQKISRLEEDNQKLNLVRKTSDTITSLEIDDIIGNQLGKHYEERLSTTKKRLPPSTLYAASRKDSVKNNRQSYVRSADNSPSNSPRIERQRVHSPLVKNRLIHTNHIENSLTSRSHQPFKYFQQDNQDTLSFKHKKYGSAESLYNDQLNSEISYRSKSESALFPELVERPKPTYQRISTCLNRRGSIIAEEVADKVPSTRHKKISMGNNKLCAIGDKNSHKENGIISTMTDELKSDIPLSEKIDKFLHSIEELDNFRLPKI